MNKKIQKVVKLIGKLATEAYRLEGCAEGSKKIPKILEKIQSIVQGDLQSAVEDVQEPGE